MEREKGKIPMAEPEGSAEEEERLLMEEVPVLDFNVLCSQVALQTHGKWSKGHAYERIGEQGGDFAGEFGGVFRMWEGDLLDCFDDRAIALESAFCPCCRFGKNMRRSGFGSCFLQAIVYSTLAAAALANVVAFLVTKRHCFLYLGIAFIISVGTYLGIHRSQIRKRFNIAGSDGSLDDCLYHLVCPCCTLSQESRTLEINNVQDGAWCGPVDRLCVGGCGEGRKTFFELSPPPIMSAMQPEPPIASPKCPAVVGEHSWICQVGHSEPSSIPPSQYY